jgi:hypothetical protein
MGLLGLIPSLESGGSGDGTESTSAWVAATCAGEEKILLAGEELIGEEPGSKSPRRCRLGVVIIGTEADIKGFSPTPPRR